MDFKFKGVLCPVFTPFRDDKCRTINYDVIDRYSNFLKTKGVDGVLVNGWTGEGMTLTVDERKKVAEEWVRCGHKIGLKVFLLIGGCTTLAETYDLAEHAERIRVDCCLVVPDPFYRKHMTEEDLVRYLKDIHVRMNTRPFFYVYHKRDRVNHRIDMFKFLDIIEREIPTYCGNYYDDSVKCDEVALLKCYKNDKTHIRGTKLTMLTPIIEGHDVLCISMANLYPDLYCKLFEHLKGRRYDDACVLKDKLIRTYLDWTRDAKYEHWHPTIVMKNEFNKKFTDINLGPVRMPTLTMKHLFY